MRSCVRVQLLREVVFNRVDGEGGRGDAGEGQVDSSLDAVGIPDRDVPLADVERKGREPSGRELRFDAEPLAAVGRTGEHGCRGWGADLELEVVSEVRLVRRVQRAAQVGVRWWRYVQV